MATAAAANTRSYAFDERNIRWYKLEDFEYFLFAMLDVDAPEKIADFIAKFEPNQKIFEHQRLTLTNTMMLQGEHRIYEPDGSL